jgi:PDZ domain-containing protein
MAMSVPDTQQRIVPAAPVLIGPPPRRTWWVLGLVGTVIGGIVGTASVVAVPYVRFTPGSAYATQPLVHVADESRAFESEGEIFFTTVHLDGVSEDSRVSVLEALDGWRDPDVDVYPDDLILGDQSRQENERENQQMMDSSKDTAVLVALAYLGYQVAAHGTGATIVDLVEAAPAAAAGLQPGDTIVAVNGETIELSDQLGEQMRGTAPGEAVILAVSGTDGAGRDVPVTVAARPDDPAAGFLGVSTQTRDLDYDLPFEVSIDTTDIGGPSAGLAFTLAVLDVLTPGSLTGGRDVAVTGTIRPDGTVGPVGGVTQKIAAAQRKGTQLFLVPTDEVQEARAKAGSALRVEPVATLDDALAVLGSLGGNAHALPRTGQVEGA